MCGIVGIAGDFTTKHVDSFKNMLYADAVRGDHGTGVASISISNAVDWIKRQGGPTDLADSKGFDKVVSTTSKVLIGHNRHATTGGRTTNNAHPFEFPEIIGVHNGTIPPGSRSVMKHDYKYDTDSETLYADLNDMIRNQGMTYDDALAEELKKLDGAWCLVFWARKAKKLCMIRNKERPLFYAWLKDKKGIVWASEAWLLFGPLARNGLELEDGKAHVLPEDTLFSWDIDGSAGSTVGEPERRKITGRPFVPAVITPQYTAPTTGGSVMRSSNIRYSARQLFEERKDKHFRAPYFDPNTERTISKPDFVKLIDAGHSCVYCNDHKPKWNEEVLILKNSPTGSPQYLCHECLHDEEVIDILSHMA